jgi:hypothetical protein
MSQPSTPPRSIDLEEFERRLREPQQTGSQPDPLSELARLVGGAERDPFAAVFSDQTKAAPQSRPRTPIAPQQFAYSQRQSAPAHYAPEVPVAPLPDFLRQSAPHRAPDPYVSTPSYHTQVEPPAYADPYASYNMQGTSAGEQSAYHDQYAQAPSYDQTAYAQNEGPWMPSDHYAQAPADFSYEEPRSHRTAYIVAGIFAVAGIVIAGAFTLRSLSGPKEAPVIAALTSPTKVQPDNSASDNADNPSASVLDRGQTNDAQAKIVNRA